MSDSEPATKLLVGSAVGAVAGTLAPGLVSWGPLPEVALAGAVGATVAVGAHVAAASALE